MSQYLYDVAGERDLALRADLAQALNDPAHYRYTGMGAVDYGPEHDEVPRQVERPSRLARLRSFLLGGSA